MDLDPGRTPNTQLRRERELRGWSQKRVADAVGTSKFMVSRWEGGIKTPGPHFREQLCLLFGKNAEELGFTRPLTNDQGAVETRLIWHVPLRRNPFFTGREMDLAQLYTALQTSRTAALSQAISGLGGIGKTSLAVEYAYRYRAYYQAILWVEADSREHLLANLVRLTGVLGLPEQYGSDQDQAVAAVQRWLQGHSNWLLIVDNLEDFRLGEEVLPAGPGHLLITTQAHATGFVAFRLELAPLPPEEGILLLLRRARLLPLDAPLSQAPSAAQNWAESITEHLDGLPLALDQAGAYVEETRCSLEGYLRRLKTHQGALLQRRGQMTAGHPASVASTLSISMQRVRAASEEAAEVLEGCAFLHPKAIPEEFLVQNAPEPEPRLTSVKADLVALDAILEVLGRFSLIQRNPESRTISLHRLVQTVLQGHLSLEIHCEWIERTVRALNAALPEVTFATWPQYERYLPHALACIQVLNSTGEKLPEASDLLYKVGSYLLQRGAYREAEPLLTQAVVFLEQQHGKMHPAIIPALIQSGSLSWRSGKYQQAGALLHRALNLCEQHLGEEHPSTIETLNQLGELFWWQADYEQAEQISERVLKITESHFGSTHIQTAEAAGALASIYRDRGKYAAALALYQRALAICDQQSKAASLLMGTVLHHLGILHYVQGNYEQAEEAYQQALALREEHLGKGHPNTADSLNNLALVLQEQGMYAQAEQLYRRVLDISEHSIGSNHPETAASLQELALLYRRQGKYEQAMQEGLHALTIFEQQLGETHPKTAHMLHDLAMLTLLQGQEEQAEALCQRALCVREQRLGPTHPQTAETLTTLATIFREQGRYDQAEIFYLQALRIFEQQLGPSNVHTAYPLHHLALLSASRGEYVQAEAWGQRALHIREQKLGPIHPQTAETLTTLAAISLAQGREQEAEALYRRALAICEKRLGTGHPETARNLRGLAELSQR